MSVHIQDMALNTTETLKILIRIFLLLLFSKTAFFFPVPLYLIMHTSWKEERKKGRKGGGPEGRVFIIFHEY